MLEGLREHNRPYHSVLSGQEWQQRPRSPPWGAEVSSGVVAASGRWSPVLNRAGLGTPDLTASGVAGRVRVEGIRTWGAWTAQMVKPLPSVQVTISASGHRAPCLLLPRYTRPPPPLVLSLK